MALNACSLTSFFCPDGCRSLALNRLSEMASQFPGWCNTEALEDLYIDAKVAGADGAILSSERTARRYLNARGVSGVSMIL